MLSSHLKVKFPQIMILLFCYLLALGKWENRDEIGLNSILLV